MPSAWSDRHLPLLLPVRVRRDGRARIRDSTRLDSTRLDSTRLDSTRLDSTSQYRAATRVFRTRDVTRRAATRASPRKSRFPHPSRSLRVKGFSLRKIQIDRAENEGPATLGSVETDEPLERSRALRSLCIRRHPPCRSPSPTPLINTLRSHSRSATVPRQKE